MVTNQGQSEHPAARTYAPSRHTKSARAPQYRAADYYAPTANRAQKRTEYAVVGNTVVKQRVAPQEDYSPKPAPKPRSQPRPRLGLARKIVLIGWITGIVVAGCMLMNRYVEINEQYSGIREIKKEIAAAEIKLDELSVAIECSSDIEMIEQVAKKNGMGYPAAEQVLTLGQIPDGYKLSADTAEQTDEDGNEDETGNIDEDPGEQPEGTPED